MQQDAGDRERIGYLAGVLSTGSTKTTESVTGNIIATLHRYTLDGVCHVLYRDSEKSPGYRLCIGTAAGGIAYLIGQQRELLLHQLQIQRLIGTGTEHAGKVVRLQSAEHQVAVGDGQGATIAVTGGTGKSTGRFRPYPVAGTVELEHRAPASSHGVYPHHRRTQPHTGHFGFEGPFKLSGEMADISGSSSHIEADQPVESRRLTGAHHTDHATCRSGKDRILALKVAGIGQTAIGLHKHQAAPGSGYPIQRSVDTIHVAPQNRGEVGVHDGGVPPAHQLHQRTDPGAHRNLGKTDLCCNLRDL